MIKMLLIFTVCLGTISFLFYGHVNDCFVYYNKPLATISYIAIIFSAVFVAYQAYLFRRDYETRKERLEFDTAYKMAGYYAKNILPDTIFANKILSDLNLRIDKDFYKKSNQFVDFTLVEAQQIFGNDVINKFKKEICELDFSYFYLYEYHRTKTPQVKIKKEWDNLFKSNYSQSKNKKDFSDPVAKQFYADKKTEILNHILAVLNEFEYFAMYFCSGLAAPENVYMSIHQTYLEFITNNYLLICSQNSKPGHEYYTHAIRLYNNWNDISDQKDEEREKAIKAINKPEKPKKIHL